jgi:C4-dicarboxylate-binding protein DctP
MKKSFWISLLALALAVPVLGAERADCKSMKVAHVMAVDSARHKALLEFQKYVKDASGGELTVELFPSGQLGEEPDLIESMKMGTIEGYVGGAFDHLTPKLNLFVMPFMFPDLDAFLRVAKSPQAATIVAAAEKNGVKILAIGSGGSRQITNNVRPIKTPADMKGLKMRTPPMEPVIQTMKAMGANPVMIPYGDVYMALKTGVVDGQENPFMNAATMKFHEVQKYLTVINYMWAPEPFCVGKAWFDALSPKLKKIVQDGAVIYTDKQNELRAQSDTYYFDMMKKSGIQVYTPTSDEQKAFSTVAVPVYGYFVSKGQFTQQELDTFKTLVSGQ